MAKAGKNKIEVGKTPVISWVPFIILLIMIFGLAGISFIPDPSWSEEVVLTLMSYMAVLSAALAIRRKAHIRMTAFDRFK